MEIVLATLLLMSPKEIDENWIEVLRPTILTIAVSNELLDPKECSLLFTQNLMTDLEMLRSRREELLNCPRLEDCQLFPDRKLIADLLSMNRSYLNSLNEQLKVDLNNEDVLRDAIIETDQLYRVWDILRDAQCEWYYVTHRRQALKLLRELLGAEAYYRAQLPSPIPVRHLQRR